MRRCMIISWKMRRALSEEVCRVVKFALQVKFCLAAKLREY